jgi:hypothetical protein
MRALVSILCFCLIASLFYSVEPLRPVHDNRSRELASNHDDIKSQVIKTSKQNPYFLSSLKAIKYYRGHAHLDKSIKHYTVQVLKSVKSNELKEQLKKVMGKSPVENFLSFNNLLEKRSAKDKALAQQISSIKMPRFDVLGNQL